MLLEPRSMVDLSVNLEKGQENRSSYQLGQELDLAVELPKEPQRNTLGSQSMVDLSQPIDSVDPVFLQQQRNVFNSIEFLFDSTESYCAN